MRAARRRTRRFAFGHKSLPIRIASPRRAKLTCADTHISCVEPQTPNSSFTFLKGNIFFNFPTPIVRQKHCADCLPAGVFHRLKSDMSSFDLTPSPLEPPLGSAPTMAGRHRKHSDSVNRPPFDSRRNAIGVKSRVCGVELGF